MEGTTEHLHSAAGVEGEAEERERKQRESKRGSAGVTAGLAKGSRVSGGDTGDDSAARGDGTHENGRYVAAGDGEDAEGGGRPVEIPAQERPITPREPVEINLRTLLQAGVHFGHQTARWNPAMAPYIHGARNGIHIISLPKTVSGWEQARKAIIDIVGRGGSVLFVGTKKQAHDAVIEEARRCGAFYVAQRWLGGMMTNFQTIRKSIARMNRLEEILAEEQKALSEGTGARFTKKERLMMSRERDKLYYSLGGIRTMYAPPQLMFVVDVNREDIAVKEASRLDIPVVALVDTNCDPKVVDFPIPSNDDGTRAIRLFCAAIADAVMEGKKVHQKHLAAESAAAAAAKKSRRAQQAAASADAERDAEQGGSQQTQPGESAEPEAVEAAPAADGTAEGGSSEA